MEVVASLSQGRTAAAQCGLFTYKLVPVIFEPPCNSEIRYGKIRGEFRPRQTRQLPRAIDLKGRLLSCQSY